jgi:hypothetical protein
MINIALMKSTKPWARVSAEKSTTDQFLLFVVGFSTARVYNTHRRRDEGYVLMMVCIVVSTTF